MAKDSLTGGWFWSGIAAGAIGSAALFWLARRLERRRVRLEHSVQLRCSPEELFGSFARLQRLPEFVRSLLNVVSQDDVSRWRVELDGRDYEFDAEILRVIPNQIIDWRGEHPTRHGGRLSFFSSGDQSATVLLELEYEEGMPLLSLPGSHTLRMLQSAIADAFDDLKAEVEKPGQLPSLVYSETKRYRSPEQQIELASGTYGGRPRRSVERSSNGEDYRLPAEDEK